MTSNTVDRGTVLVTGASRGLGKALAALYAADGFRVIACMRQAAAGAEPLDVADAASIAALGERLEGEPVDIVINNAAIRGDTGGLASLETENFLEVMRINALAPLLVARALRSNLLAGSRKVLVNIGSRAGSLAEGTMDDADGDYAYRCSKAALNMATLTLARDLRADGIAVISLHPGWVRTDMGGAEAAVDVRESAAGLKALIDGTTMAETGSFRAYDGRTVAW
ncbi:SDR family oxidoreductase [Shinella sp. BYT-45]|uniref:SDR family oxidoreductase n=1 Tax=Shinella sp. BYT-45 TaxID=3377377 RepID=UPI00397EB3C4